MQQKIGMKNIIILVGLNLYSVFWPELYIFLARAYISDSFRNSLFFAISSAWFHDTPKWLPPNFFLRIKQRIGAKYAEICKTP